MTAAPTFSQIKAQVAAIRRKEEGARVFGIRAQGRWTGDRSRRDGDQLYLIDQCDSPLAVRIALREELDPSATKVVVTGLDEQDLSEDILLRLAKRRLFPLDPWQIVKNLFQAHAIDPRLTRHPWIADSLMESIPEGGYPAASGGFLDAETVWPIVLRQLMGLSDERPDLASVLRWSTEAAAVARYRAATQQFRDAAAAWLSDVAGPAVHEVLRSVESSERPDALPIGLALGVVYNSEGAKKLQKAAGRAEERFLGGVPPNDQAIERWSAAATEAIRLQITDNRSKRVLLERADEILKELGAEKFAYLSATSPLGFDQRLAEFGRILSKAIESGRFDDTAELLAARRDIGNHEYAIRDRSRLDCLDMAIRLVRWLEDRKQQRQGESPTSLIDAAHYHTQEGGFVDWARLLLRRGDSERLLSEAYAKLFDQVTAIREEQAKVFAQLLRTWTESDHQSEAIVPVERLIEEIVAPLAGQGPVLFIVIDGMSIAVCRELLAEIVGDEWLPLNREGRVGQCAAGLATIPSVTEVSRTSLLCGELRQGASADEQRGFSAHPALKAVCRGGQLPVVFHKPSLSAEDDAILAGDVRAEIASSSRRVVGVVINAVDDLLLKGEQVGHRWTRDSIPVLGALLHEAKLSKRLVVITSDHGHVIDKNSRFQAHEGGERWRTASGEPTNDELRIRGRRVVIPESKTVIVPWTENLRYGIKKYGYHGGVNPQEMVTPIVVLSPSEAPVEGWVEVSADIPVWWEEGAVPVSPKPVVSPKLPSRKREKELPLFDFENEPDPARPPAPETRSTEPAWIAKLLESPLFELQKRLAGRAVPSDEVVRELLRALDGRGGKMTSTAVSRALDFPLIRLRGLFAVMQRVLNVDGFSVLTRDEASDTVELNRDLLKRQFDLE